MASIDRFAERLHVDIDTCIATQIELGCQRSLAHVRLERAIPEVVKAVAHPALTVERRETPHGHTETMRLAGRVLMRWCFTSRHVDVHCRIDQQSSIQLRMSYDAFAGLWRLSLPGRRPCAGTFADEEEKVVEIIGDALSGFTSSAAARFD